MHLCLGASGWVVGFCSKGTRSCRYAGREGEVGQRDRVQRLVSNEQSESKAKRQESTDKEILHWRLDVPMVIKQSLPAVQRKASPIPSP